VQYVTGPKQASVFSYHLISFTTRLIISVYNVCALVSLTVLQLYQLCTYKIRKCRTIGITELPTAIVRACGQSNCATRNLVWRHFSVLRGSLLFSWDKLDSQHYVFSCYAVSSHLCSTVLSCHHSAVCILKLSSLHRTFLVQVSLFQKLATGNLAFASNFINLLEPEFYI